MPHFAGGGNSRGPFGRRNSSSNTLRYPGSGFDSADDLLTMDDDGNMSAKRVKEGPERRLQRMVDMSEERTAKILRKWASNEKAA